MVRKLGLWISYFVAIVYFLSILLPAIYCLQHGCKSPDLDAFMPAFMLTPLGAITTAFSLRNAIQQIKKRNSWSWAFWPLAIIFAIVLLGAITLIALLIYFTAFHRR
jgi:Ni/Fe-hydrogenase subunit HybB-like protein